MLARRALLALWARSPRASERDTHRRSSSRRSSAVNLRRRCKLCQRARARCQQRANSAVPEAMAGHGRLHRSRMEKAWRAGVAAAAGPVASASKSAGVRKSLMCILVSCGGDTLTVSLTQPKGARSTANHEWATPLRTRSVERPASKRFFTHISVRRAGATSFALVSLCPCSSRRCSRTCPPFSSRRGAALMPLHCEVGRSRSPAARRRRLAHAQRLHGHRLRCCSWLPR